LESPIRIAKFPSLEGTIEKISERMSRINRAKSIGFLCSNDSIKTTVKRQLVVSSVDGRSGSVRISLESDSYYPCYPLYVNFAREYTTANRLIYIYIYFFFFFAVLSRNVRDASYVLSRRDEEESKRYVNE